MKGLQMTNGAAQQVAPGPETGLPIQAQARPRADTLTGDPAAILILSAGRIIKGLNPLASELYGVAAGDNVRRLPFGDACLQRLADACARAEVSFEEEYIRLDRLDGGCPVLGALRAFRTSDGVLVQFRSSDFALPKRLGRVLDAAFGLTQAEIEIVAHIVEGRNITKIADLRGSSLATVRSQIRTIYEKAGTHSQIELMHMVTGLMLTFSRPISVLA